MAKIDTSGWKEFEVGKLFPDIVKPAVLHTRQVVEVENGIPYVVRTKFNNGIKYRVEKTSDMKLSPAGVITFGAENATFFYQTEAFVSGRDVYYIDTRNLSANTCLFLTACLQPIAKKYSYNNGLFPELLKKEVFLLPIDPHGQPDWASMDRFMAKTMKRSKASLSDLRRALAI